MLFPTATPSTISCCLCGAKAPSDRVVEGMCVKCLGNQVDVTEGIERNLEIELCRTCEQQGKHRWYRNPQWILLEPESPELLSLCVRKIRGLKSVEVVDASWIWTEPHSRRLKVKLTVRKEVLSGTTLQQSMVVEYVVKTRNCDRCNKDAAKDTWQAKVQVAYAHSLDLTSPHVISSPTNVSCSQLRQRAEHPRTLLSLEQAIRQHRMARGAVKVEAVREGLDFNFHRRQEAQAFVSCICAIAPARVKPSTSVVAVNAKTGTSNVRHVWALEVAPVCRHDLVWLSKPLSSSRGRVGPLALVSRIGHAIHLVDPTTGCTAEVSNESYWRQPFSPIGTRAQLSTFVVMDAELDQRPGKPIPPPPKHKGAERRRKSGQGRETGGGGGGAEPMRSIAEDASEPLCAGDERWDDERRAVGLNEGVREAGEVAAPAARNDDGSPTNQSEGSVVGSVTWRGWGYSSSKGSCSSRRGDGARPWLIGDVTVARESDLGSNDETMCVRSHLTELLGSGDEVLGYDLDAMSHLMSSATGEADAEWPSAVLVQKKDTHANRSRRSRSDRRRRGSKSDAGSTTTNTSYQDLGVLNLDELVDVEDDGLDAEGWVRLNGLIDKLATGGDDGALEGENAEIGESEVRELK